MELRPADLLKEWRAGRFRPVYYLVGEEVSAKAEALARLKELLKPDDFNFREFAGETAEQAAAAVSEAVTLPVFADRRLVVVTSAKLPAESRALLAEYLKTPLASTTLVLFSEDKKPDPKDALARAAGDGVCVFAPLRDDEARARLLAAARAAGKTLAEEAADALIAEVGTEWAVLSQELEKALLFSASQKIEAADVLQCLGYQKSTDPFALTRLIQERDLRACLAHLRRMLSEGKPEDQAFRALAQINASVGKQFRAKRMVSAGTPPEAVFRSLRLHAYWDRGYLERLGRFSEARLAADLKRCLSAETSLKSKSWLDPRIEIEHLVVALCRAGVKTPAAAAR